MWNNYTIEITYQSYWKDKSYTFNIEPYCLKVFKQRWYAIVRSSYYDAVLIYALDRIQDLYIMDIPFYFLKAFDPQSYFNYSFGFIVDKECDIEKIRIKVYGFVTRTDRSKCIARIKVTGVESFAREMDAKGQMSFKK